MGDSGAYYPNEKVFPPAARVDEYIAIVYGPGDVRYAKVLYVEPIPIYSKAFLLKASETLTEQELDRVEVGDNEVLQARIAVLGAVKVNVKLPRTTSRFTLRRESGYITEDIAGYPRFPPFTEVNILEDTHMFVDITNLNANHAERGKVYITGWRMVFEYVREKPRAYAALIVQGFAPRSRVRG